MEKRKIITVTSGKGGVGKSSIVSNMARILSKNKERAYIFDADLSLGNIDIMFGIIPKFSIKDVLEGTKDINDVIVEGPEGIKIIPATSGVSQMSELNPDEQGAILSILAALPEYDYLIIDTSAGISSNVVYFNTISQSNYVIITPDPASIMDSYATIKVLHKQSGRQDFNVIINMVKNEDEAVSVFKKLIGVTDRFLDVYINFMGFLPIDINVNNAVKKQKLFVDVCPSSPAAISLTKICDRISSIQ
ncbi:MAG TPA: flagellar synthesis regulator FleN [Actinobacteria bacterium]|nr:flagellar synthesis regulator FleN [Actinomycetota bacterium]